MHIFYYQNKKLVIDYRRLTLLAENMIAYPDKHNEISDCVYSDLIKDTELQAMNKFLKEIKSNVFLTRNRYHNKLYFRHRKISITE